MVDAPEGKQPFGKRSKQSLSEKVFGKQVSVEVVDTDLYRRKVGIIRIDGQSVSVQQVAEGFSWWYRKYAPKDQELEKAELSAREQKRGLWSDPHAVEPWEWRKRR